MRARTRTAPWNRMPLAIAAASAAMALLALALQIRQVDAEVYYGCEAARTTGSSETSGAGGLMLGADLDEMTDGSTDVVAGTVTSLQTCYSNDDISIVTFVTMDVDEALKVKGDNPDSTIPIAVAGGTIGGHTLAVGTSPEFTAGERVVAFLGRDAHGDLVPSFGFQGVFGVAADGSLDRGGLTFDEFAEAIAAAEVGDLSVSADPLTGGPEIIESAYKKNGPKFADSDIPMQININPDNNRPSQLSAQDTRIAVINSYQSWQDLSDSYIAFGPFTNTTRTSKQGDCDGKHDVTWKISGSHSSSTLAVTYTCYSSKILDGDIEIDTDHAGSKWRVDGTGSCASGKYDLETVLLHEAGHFLGLGHPGNTNCKPCPVMNASYGGVNRTPCSDDADGAHSLYTTGGGSPPAAPGTLTAAPGTDIALSWDNVSDEKGFEVWRAEGVCGAGDFELHDTVKSDTLTYTDIDYGDGLGTAAFCYQVRAFNKNGESAFSPAALGLAGGAQTPTPTPPPPLSGDVNCDSLVTASDTMDILGSEVDVEDEPPCIANGDLDCDGEVNTEDALGVLLVVSGVSEPQALCS